MMEPCKVYLLVTIFRFLDVRKSPTMFGQFLIPLSVLITAIIRAAIKTNDMDVILNRELFAIFG